MLNHCDGLRSNTLGTNARKIRDMSDLESDPIIPYANPETLPPPLKAKIDEYEKRMGFLPNALKLYMHRPEILKCLVELNNTVMRDDSGHLDQGLKRRIAAVCSALNHSPYCVAHNANTLKTSEEADGEGWGYQDEDVRALLNPDYVPDDPVEAACFAFARAATRDPSDVPQAVIKNMTDTLTPPQVVELACTVGFWRMYNSIHESIYVPIEDELLGDAELSDDELLGELGPGGDAPSKAEVEIFTTHNCPYCRQAKRVLAAKRLDFLEIAVDGDSDALETMINRTKGARTVPQIFIDGTHIGGMDSLTALARAGQLDKMLGLVAKEPN